MDTQVINSTYSKTEQQLIDDAIKTIEKTKYLTDIKTLCEWRAKGIIRAIKKCENSMFIFDKEIEFTDGRKIITWI